MSKADKERQARRQRMLARERGHTSTYPIPGTSGDIGLRTPQPVRRSRGTTPPPTPEKQPDNVKSFTPLIQQRQRRHYTVLAVLILCIAAAVFVFTGAMSASIALLGDAADSLSLYFNRSDGGWPVNTGISEPIQIAELAGGFVELDSEDVVVYSAYGAKVRSFQPGYARPVMAVGGTHFVVYNRAGSDLQVSSRTKALYTKTFDNSILLCAMSNNNTLAVVTESGRYAAQLQIFDPSFRQTYSWEMTQNEGTPIAVDFSPDNRQFAAGTLAARQGQLGCKVYFMSTSSNSEGPAYTASQGSMLLSLDWQSESRVVAVFDTYIAVLDPRTATETARYDFGGATLQSAAPGQRQTALLLNIRGGNSLVTLDNDLTPLAEIPARQAYGIKATDTSVYLLCPNAVECYGFDGVQNWVQDNFSARPIQVLKASELLVFTGSRAEVLTPPDNANNTNNTNDF